MSVLKHLDKLLSLDPRKKINKCSITNLTAPGDHYGSIMLRVDLVLETPAGLEELHVVAKTPPGNQLLQEMFNTKVTFRNEIYFYHTVVPILKEFQRDYKVPEITFCPRYFGSRFNLKGTGSDEIDSDAVIVLENLKISNYANAERTKGFDLDASKLILSDLAHLHAVALALRVKKPEVWNEKVRPYLRRIQLTDDFKGSIERKFLKLLKSTSELQPLLDRVLQISFSEMFPPDAPREPFATLNHIDCWVNNTMQVWDANGKPVKNKLVDFQVCDYGSPAKDVLFFLFTSVKIPVLEQHCDDLIEFYYEAFVSLLKSFEIDISVFSRDAFDKEIRYEAKKSQLIHVLLMLFPIFAPAEEVPEFSDIKPSEIGSEKPTQEHREKLIFVVKEFVRRNWI